MLRLQRCTQRRRREELSCRHLRWTGIPVAPRPGRPRAAAVVAALVLVASALIVLALAVGTSLAIATRPVARQAPAAATPAAAAEDQNANADQGQTETQGQDATGTAGGTGSGSEGSGTETAAPVLPDGDTTAYITKVASDRIVVDVVQVFHDDQAVKAAVADGKSPSDAKYLTT